MNIYVLGNEIVTLFLALGVNLIIHFNDPVTVAGGNSKIQINALNNNKSFVINQVDKRFKETNLTFFNDDGAYNVVVKSSSKHAHSFVNFHKGEVDNSFSLVFENKYFRVLNGEKSTLIEAKEEEGVIVNGEIVKTSTFTSKNAPLFVRANNTNFLLNPGREL